MPPPTTLRELLVHNDWARDKVMELAVDLPDPPLDHAHEMGLGTLRKTLHHIWAAERIWLDRWMEKSNPTFVEPEPGISVKALWARFRDTAAERNDLLDRLGENGEGKRITFRNRRGETHTYPLGDMLLHVANHGTHHRAQASNMLRHSGSPVPGLDYLFYRVEFPTAVNEPATLEKLRQFGMKPGASASPPARFDRDSLLEYCHYGDWASRRVIAAAAGLTDAQLDRKFEMGLGTLRRTLMHIYDAETWWVENWKGTPESHFQRLPDSTALAALQGLYDSVIERRDAFISALDETGLNRVVACEPGPGVKLRFRIGESLMQLGFHGTHHRAQASNMLRRLGATPPELDYVLYFREACSSPS